MLIAVQQYPRSCRHLKLYKPEVNDGEFWLQLWYAQSAVAKMYCHNMTYWYPEEFISLVAGMDTNFARAYKYKLENRYSCSGREILNPIARGTTYFAKVRLDIQVCINM